MAYYLGCVVVLCTATQPALNEVANPLRFASPVDLVPDYQLRFAQFRRTKIEVPETGNGFQAGELLSSEQPNFNEMIDPKCDWALRHLELFPVEVETASYAELLRVPGVGPKSASRIVNARRYGRMDFTSLKKMGVVLKRAHYFITCGGKQMYHTPLEETYITRQLVSVDRKESWEMAHANEGFSQMTLADFGIG